MQTEMLNTDMQLLNAGQIGDGPPGQVNQPSYQSAHYAHYTLEPSLADFSGLTGIAGPAVPGVLPLPGDLGTKSFLSTLYTKADMDHKTATLQQVHREEFQEVKKSLYSLMSRVDTMEQNQTPAEIDKDPGG